MWQSGSKFWILKRKNGCWYWKHELCIKLNGIYTCQQSIKKRSKKETNRQRARALDLMTLSLLISGIGGAHPWRSQQLGPCSPCTRPGTRTETRRREESQPETSWHSWQRQRQICTKHKSRHPPSLPYKSHGWWKNHSHRSWSWVHGIGRQTRGEWRHQTPSHKKQTQQQTRTRGTFRRLQNCWCNRILWCCHNTRKHWIWQVRRQPGQEQRNISFWSGINYSNGDKLWEKQL